MKKLIWIMIIVGSLGVCLWVSINALNWLTPARPETYAIELADLDSDGDLDAFLANGRNEATEPNTVLWNDGHGNFQDSGQQLGAFESRDLALADFDNDGDIDALVSNISWGEYFWNDGYGQFQRSQFIAMPDNDGYPVGLWRFQPGDLDGDNRVDLFLTGCCGGGISKAPNIWQTLNASNSILLNNTSRFPNNNSQQFGQGNSEAVALADLDGDGDLDAFLANSLHRDENGDTVDNNANEVWFNNGYGTFTDSYQRLGEQRSYTVAIGDLDGDGDLDALVGNRAPDEVWWNNGQGHFSQGEQTLGDTLTRYLYLTDLDGDDDLDAFLGDDKQGYIWLNDGDGYFSDSGQRLNYSSRHAIALGDINDDGTIDIIAGRLDRVIVWLNDGTGQVHK